MKISVFSVTQISELVCHQTIRYGKERRKGHRTTYADGDARISCVAVGVCGHVGCVLLAHQLTHVLCDCASCSRLHVFQWWRKKEMPCKFQSSGFYSQSLTPRDQWCMINKTVLCRVYTWVQSSVLRFLVAIPCYIHPSVT
jgi:hypothetical protein